METGILPREDDEEEDVEIELVEEEPPFLHGHGRALGDLSPVRIVKNPDGSLAQAAMMQSALAKERREQKMLQREQEMDSVPTGLNKNWIDPLPEGNNHNHACPYKILISYYFHSRKQNTGGEHAWDWSPDSGSSRMEEARDRWKEIIVWKENELDSPRAATELTDLQAQRRFSESRDGQSNLDRDRRDRIRENNSNHTVFGRGRIYGSWKNRMHPTQKGGGYVRCQKSGRRVWLQVRAGSWLHDTFRRLHRTRDQYKIHD